MPRLLFLVAIVLAGWPMIVLFARPRAEEKPPPPPLLADRIEPVVPDDGVEFESLIDKKPNLARESTAYATLLQRARDTPPAELASKARRDIFWTHLWERPRLYRGVPVHFDGIAKKVLTHDVAPTMTPRRRLFEAWIYSDENPKFPYVVVFEDPPVGLAIGHELHLPVTVDAYFLKLLSYEAGDVPRAAPELIGHLRLRPAPAAAPSPMVELRNWTRRDGFVFFFVALFGYIALRVFFQVRKAIDPSRARVSRSVPSEGLPPEEVSDWLKNLPDQEFEPEDDALRPRDGPGRSGR